MKALRGRAIVEITPLSHTRASGIVILNRKDVSSKGKVVSVGDESRTVKGKPIKAPCKKGDTIHFRKFVPMFHKGMKEGKVTLFWEDVVCVERPDLAEELAATYDNIIIQCKSKATTSTTLIIPEQNDTMEHAFKGIVVSIGPDYPDGSLKVGDKIVYPRNEGIKIIYKDQEYLKLKEKWVLGRINA